VSEEEKIAKKKAAQAKAWAKWYAGEGGKRYKARLKEKRRLARESK
jgi:hypothetical protein